MATDVEHNQPENSRLLEEFPSHTYDQWKQAAEDLLKGAPFDKVMVTPTYEGFDLQPLYTLEHAQKLVQWGDDLPGQGSKVRGASKGGYRERPWWISQELGLSTPKEFNTVARHELENGQSELNIWLDKPGREGVDPDHACAQSVGFCGTSITGVSDLAQMFNGIYLNYISVYWRAGLSPVALSGLYFAYAERAGVDFKELQGCIEADPIAFLVENGRLPFELGHAYDEMAALTAYAADNAPKLQTIGVQTHVYHNAGGASHQEMAFALATGVEYLRAMQARGLKPEKVAPRMRFSLSIGPNYFLEIAKFRALRMLWNKVLESFEVPEEARKIYIHARTGLWNKTTIDPYVNLLRTCTEGFSAVVAGVDGLAVGTFDEVIREPDNFSRRIARNLHHILGEECDLTKVIDPAGGSWAVESLTQQMAGQAWQLFQEVETAGGMVQALRDGFAQVKTQEVLAQKLKKIHQRRDTIVGTNNYPNPLEKALEPREIDYAAIAKERCAVATKAREQAVKGGVHSALQCLSLADPVADPGVIVAAINAAKAGMTLGQINEALRQNKTGSEQVERIKMQRGSQTYEDLRSSVLALGDKATILQVNYGPSRRYRARADWTSAFYRVGGFNVLSDVDFNSIDEAVAAIKETNARIAVVTSDDETYGKVAVDLAKALKAANPDLYLILAGAPGDSEAAWREAGIDNFVNVRVSNYDMNQALLQRLK
ncbi:MAG: methylmalonyl-CoA mutase family protein [Verrucomicrobiota bacterium JB022]|nr:methylmalonyl-CoA mutase family protein [Verrucomicrobiota bacterium JB022]